MNTETSSEGIGRNSVNPFFVSASLFSPAAAGAGKKESNALLKLLHEARHAKTSHNHTQAR
jgi:hypothetical protein